MFKRKITGSIQRWKDSPRRKCLLVVGARGVGKTSVIRDFIEHNYESSLTIDLMADTDLHRAFNGDLNADSILSRIRAMRPDIDPVPGRTVIFLDGIQACPYARMSLKYLVEDGRFDIIASGTLLGFEYSDATQCPYADAPDLYDTPVGYERILNMRSMDFEEFLWAIGTPADVILDVKDRIATMSPIDDAVLSSMEGLFREFMSIGGMPQAISEYIRGGHEAARKEQTRILEGYRRMASTHAKPGFQDRIIACLDSIPDPSSRECRGMCASELSWLVDAGIVDRVFDLRELTEPLDEHEGRDRSKTFMSDTGLLTAMWSSIGSGPSGDTLSTRTDPITRNAVVESLTKNGATVGYLSGGSSGMDLVVPSRDGTMVIGMGHNDFDRDPYCICKEYEIGRRIMLGDTNIEVDDQGVEHYPLFASAFLYEVNKGSLPSERIDVSEINELYGR